MVRRASADGRHARRSGSPRMSVTSPASMATSVPRAHRDADVGLRERGRVVDAVADHRDHAALRPAAAGSRRASARAAPRPPRARCRPSRATLSAVRAVVAGEHDDLEAHARERARPRRALVGLTGSATAMSPASRAVHRHVHRRAAHRAAKRRPRPRERRRVDAELAHQRARCRRRPGALDRRRATPVPGDGSRSPVAGRVAAPRSARLGARSRRPADARSSARPRRRAPAAPPRSRRRSGAEHDVCHRRPALGDRAGLVEARPCRRAWLRSSASPPLMSTPSSAPRPVATITAVGTASPMAQGRR